MYTVASDGDTIAVVIEWLDHAGDPGELLPGVDRTFARYLTEVRFEIFPCACFSLAFAAITLEPEDAFILCSHLWVTMATTIQLRPETKAPPGRREGAPTGELRRSTQPPPGDGIRPGAVKRRIPAED